MLLCRIRPLVHSPKISIHNHNIFRYYTQRPYKSLFNTTINFSFTSQIRSCSSTATKVEISNQKKIIEDISLPPLSIRVALVASTVGLATPIFAVASVIVAWNRFLPQHSWGKLLKLVIGFLIGGGVITLSYQYVLPFLRDHADFVLPFALANGITAAVWYLALEKMMGLKFLSGTVDISTIQPLLPQFLSTLLQKLQTQQGIIHTKLPLGGMLVGLLTAITSHFLWPIMINMCWSSEMKKIVLGSEGDATFLVDLWQYLAIPVGIPVGLTAGSGLHWLLSPILLGKGKLPWQETSVGLLGAILGISSIYFGFCHTVVQDFFWEERIDVKTGKFYSFNVKTGEQKPGTLTAERSKTSRSIAKISEFLRNPVIVVEFITKTNPQDRDFATTLHPVIEYLPTEDVEIDQLANHEQLFQLIDALTRLKYLQLLEEEQGTDLSFHKTGLENFAKRRFSVELTKLLDDAQSLIALTREYALASKAARNGFGTERKEKIHGLVLKVKEHALACAIIPEKDDPAKIASFGYVPNVIESLTTNISSFSQALSKELSYSVPPVYIDIFAEADEKRKQLEKAKKWNAAIARAEVILFELSVVSAAVALILMKFQ